MYLCICCNYSPTDLTETHLRASAQSHKSLCCESLGTNSPIKHSRALAQRLFPSIHTDIHTLTYYAYTQCTDTHIHSIVSTRACARASTVKQVIIANIRCLETSSSQHIHIRRTHRNVDNLHVRKIYTHSNTHTHIHEIIDINSSLPCLYTHMIRDVRYLECVSVCRFSYLVIYSQTHTRSTRWISSCDTLSMVCGM